MPFSAWKGMDVGEKVLALRNLADYDKRIQGYRELNRFAVEAGATIPLLQSVLTLVRKSKFAYTKYANGWVLPQSMHWS
jgi:peptide/nickel transport system substrate-binding protein